VDRWAPGEGTPIVLPTRYILPDAPREGLVLNVAEMRLYYYPKANAGEERVVYTYPVSIGRMDWKTPLGLTKVAAKEVDPAWRPPASIKAEHAAEGDILPDVIPGGPDNPLGRYAMRLGVPGYLIHSTNKPFGIGMRVTHGCVRMYPEDIERLFGMVPVGAPVRLVDQPVKVGRLNGQLMVESHAPLEEDNLPIKVTLEQAHQAVIAKTGPDLTGVDQATLELAVEQVSGIPVPISAPVRYPVAQPARLAPAGPTFDEPAPDRTPTPYRPYTAYDLPPQPVYRPTPAAPPGSASPYDDPEDDVQPPYAYPYRHPPVSAPPAYRPDPGYPAPYPRAAPPAARPYARDASREPPYLPPPNRL
jgi:L,D-transpeptidase ErfK/SrfK